MTAQKTALLLSLASLSAACGGYYSDDRVYGTWIEALDGTQIEFRTDGTVTWGEEEGTFSFVRSTNWAVCMGIGGCDDGQIRISLNNQSYRISLYKDSFDAHPDIFNIFPRNGTGYPISIPLNNREVSGLTLYREGSISGTLMPPEYTEISDGLSDEERYSRYVSQTGSLDDGTIIAKINMGIYRYNNQLETWDSIDEDGWGYNGPTPSGIILNIANHEEMSMSQDAGLSWDPLPPLERDNHYDSIVIEDTLVQVFAEFDSTSESYTNIEFWTLDLTNTQQGWTLSVSNPTFGITGFHYELRELGILAVHTNNPGTAETYISNDFGVSWHLFTDPCQGRMNHHSNGFHCVNSSATVSWFDYTDMNWSEIDVGYTLDSNSYPMSAPHTDTIHFIHNESLYQWTEEDGDEIIAPLSANITNHVGGIHVLNDRVLVHKVGLWSHWK